jgi:serine/threonine protein phosphatase PrpC
MHSPELERERICAAGGWVTVETEISLARLHLSSLGQDSTAIDPVVLRRLAPSAGLGEPLAFAAAVESRVSRICGELSVSRSLGDVDYKGAARMSRHAGWAWPPCRAPSERIFTADLVLGTPEISIVRVPEVESKVVRPFLILACDGLWEVLSSSEAVEIAARCLWEANRGVEGVGEDGGTTHAAQRLTEAAIRLGSSDNVTVIVVLL